MIIDDWQNLYSGSWRGIITSASFAHPAKYSQKLIYRIYQHAREMDWLRPGANVLDPFGGVGLGALYSMINGANWTGIEIERKFYELALENIELWTKKRYLPFDLGTANIILGDSRFVIPEMCDLVISSPPYTPDALGHHHKSEGPNASGRVKYKDGVFSAVYGETDGQLGEMSNGSFDLAISSPPYGDIAQSGGKKGMVERGIGLTGGEICFGEYGEEDGQLGRMSVQDDTFWGAAKIIVTNVYDALVPGGHAIWVVKDYVRSRKIIPFCDQWRKLCESCGFTTIHQHRAWMIRNMGQQFTIEGEVVHKKKEYKSFFRKLGETKRGLPPIDYEVVWCMEKAK